jgi:ElaB/YqjD/DUF883 family membrane-anchored ribosome-binding protein
MTEPSNARPEPGPDAGVDDIQADIEQTREELGETVQALQAKLDVKERTKEKVAETKERVLDRADTLRHTATDKADTLRHTATDKADALRHTVTDNPKRTVPVMAIVLIGALAVGIVFWRRRH